MASNLDEVLPNREVHPSGGPNRPCGQRGRGLTAVAGPRRAVTRLEDVDDQSGFQEFPKESA